MRQNNASKIERIDFSLLDYADVVIAWVTEAFTKDDEIALSMHAAINNRFSTIQEVELRGDPLALVLTCRRAAKNWVVRAQVKALLQECGYMV